MVYVYFVYIVNYILLIQVPIQGGGFKK